MSTSTAIRKYGRLITILCVSLAGIILVYWAGNRFLDIKNIEVVGRGLNVVIDQNRVPKNLLFFPGDKLREKILKDNSLVEDVKFQKKLPHTLVILISPRTAIAKINTQSGVLALDKTGVILPDNSTQPLPIFLFAPFSNVEIGERIIESQVLSALSFVNETQNFLPILSVEATGSASLSVKTAKTDIIITQDGNMPKLATTLQTLLAGFRIKGNLPTKIDLRFDKPIVTF